MFIRTRELIYRNLTRFNWNRSTSSKVAVFVFLLTLISSLAISKKIEAQKLAAEKSYISRIAKEYSTKIQNNLEQALSVTYPLAALVTEYQYQGIIPNFEVVAQELLPLYPSAYAIALLPNNSESELIFSQTPQQNSIEPIELPCWHQNQKSFKSPRQEKAILTEPLKSQKVGIGVVGCLPIFLELEDSDRSFWGFASVVVNYQQLLDNLDFKYLDRRNFVYELYAVDPQTKEQKLIIASESPAKTKQPVEEIIPLPNEFWTLRISPVGGWNKAPRFLLASLLGLFVSFLVAALVKLSLDSRVHACELEKVTYFDSLTSLPNYRLLNYRLEQIIATAGRKQKKAVICYLDLDNFKRVNDRLGTKAGDYVLVRIAKRLQKFLRVDDLIARVGGDEFAIVLQDISHVEEAELILARIVEAVTTSIVVETEVISISTSIGITMYPDDLSSVENLLRHANQAMLYAKQHHKGSYILFQNMLKKEPKTSDIQF